MKPYRYGWAVAIVICLVATVVWADSLLSIQIKKGQLRATPSFLGKIVAELDYGDRVVALDQREAWIKVRSSSENIEGWLHTSAVTTKKIILKPGASDVVLAADSDEIALAGKGFNKQVEGEFQSQNPRLDYTLIDQMERVVVSQEQIEQFTRDGRLASRGGVE